mmetsp:Transcript_53520/g.125571  ORF Transcript_53520/g.125571 Transcript_53520/m.125571 type:complete len:387 (+) Transcript_53520:2073-3233(+)
MSRGEQGPTRGLTPIACLGSRLALVSLCHVLLPRRSALPAFHPLRLRFQSGDFGEAWWAGESGREHRHLCLPVFSVLWVDVPATLPPGEEHLCGHEERCHQPQLLFTDSRIPLRIQGGRPARISSDPGDHVLPRAHLVVPPWHRRAGYLEQRRRPVHVLWRLSIKAGCGRLLYLLLHRHAALLGAAHGFCRHVDAGLVLHAGLQPGSLGAPSLRLGAWILNPRLCNGHQLPQPPVAGVRWCTHLGLLPLEDLFGNVSSFELWDFDRVCARPCGRFRLCDLGVCGPAEPLGGAAHRSLSDHLQGHARLRAPKSGVRHRLSARPGDSEELESVLSQPQVRGAFGVQRRRHRPSGRNPDTGARECQHCHRRLHQAIRWRDSSHDAVARG